MDDLVVGGGRDGSEQSLASETMDDAWVASVYPKLVRTAWTMTGDAAAEDLVQESLVSAWNAWERFQGTGSREAWMFGILLRHVRKHFRTLSRFRRRLQHYAVRRESEAREEPPSDQSIAQREWNRSVWSEVAKLPRRQAEVITLRFADQLSHEHIAEVLGCPVGTVKSRIHHALKRLQPRFSDDFRSTETSGSDRAES
ncbi:MAG: sigma-70 family RNA polymerase sigma factor [Planctomycetota bacterium]